MLGLVYSTYYSIELTFLAAYSPLVMRLGAVVVDRVAFAKYLNVIAYFYLELTTDNDIHFLSFMSMGMRNSELLVNIWYGYKEWLCDLVASPMRSGPSASLF